MKKLTKQRIIFAAPCIKKYDFDNFSNVNHKEFVCISITGKACELNCAHCDSRLLEYMINASDPKICEEYLNKFSRENIKGILISGGCDSEGRLPLKPFRKIFADFKKRNPDIKLSFHTRMVTEKDAADFASIGADRILIDVSGSDETIKNVYNLKNKSIVDEEKSLANLEKYNLSISPHIVIGINYGKIDGEYEALEMIKPVKIHSLVLVVFMPLKKTPMESSRPPAVPEVLEFFKQARLVFPDTPINFGCAKPAGDYQLALEKKALDLQFSAIAFPAEKTVEYCIDNNFDIEYSYLCCAV